MNKKDLILIAVSAVLVIAFSVAAILIYIPKEEVYDYKHSAYHTHADFKVFLYGKPYDFAQDKYMTTTDNVPSYHFHLHDGDSEIIHQHKEDAPIKTFFESLGMKFNSTCFVLDNGTAYCNEAGKQLQMYVNDLLITEFGEYKFQDLDRILIAYGPETSFEIQNSKREIRN